MNLEPIGQIYRDEDIEEWFNSDEIEIPYLDGIKLKFIIENIEDDEKPEEFSIAIKSFLNLPNTERQKASPYIFKEYKRFINDIGEDEFDFSISSQEDVWKHIHPNEIRVSRRQYEDKDIYIQITAECDWEVEHGLQIVLRKGKILTRVSDIDGHLTTADAFDLPGEQNTILYEG